MPRYRVSLATPVYIIEAPDEDAAKNFVEELLESDAGSAISEAELVAEETDEEPGFVIGGSE